MNGAVITVSQLNRYVKSLLDGDTVLRSVIVSGELSNFKLNSYSGHMYMTLKDENAAVKAVMFKSSAARLKFAPQEGMKVICRGSVTVYERDGAYQLYISDMQPDGAGSIAVAFEQLKARLSAEGLFDSKNKRAIPHFPKKIAIITSETGAAVHDMMNILGRRWPIATLVMCPVSVQGELAAPQMISALKKVNDCTDCDVIIIGRGGGSAEDLWCFNDEMLARAVRYSEIPVISAGGHETDFTICDFAADLRAPTPSAAAELAVPEISEIYSYLTSFDIAMEAAVMTMLNNYGLSLKLLTDRAVFTRKFGFIEPLELKLDSEMTALSRGYDSILTKSNARIEGLVSKLDAFNPAKTLMRGFSIAEKNGSVIRRTDEVGVGDSIDVRLSDGRLECTVEKVFYERNDGNG